MLIVVVPILFMLHRLPKFALLDSFYCCNRNAILHCKSLLGGPRLNVFAQKL
jgi:hypothetical protein